MPIIKSAQKKLRKDKVRTVANAKVKKTMRDSVKSADKASREGRGLSTKKASATQSHIDKAVKKNLIHKNKAARLKSRVAKVKRASK